jgi:phosphoribosyl 1,2-cyclic phosphodiesterase
MIVCPILSGSSGNATYIESGSTRVLVDAGGTGSAIEENLKKIGVDPRTLTCLLATHAHSDHIRGLGVLSRRYKLPIYASEGVWKQIDKGRVGCIAACCMKRFCSVSKDALDLGDIEATYFSTPHDSYDSVGYVLSDGVSSFGIATDFGHVTPSIRARMKGCDVVLLEANYDYDMLMDGPYPYPLKERIMGPEGHLENREAGEFAVELIESGVKHIFLGHLSENNNTQELAYSTVRDVLIEGGVVLEQDCCVYMTRRYEPSRKLEF